MFTVTKLRDPRSSNELSRFHLAFGRDRQKQLYRRALLRYAINFNVATRLINKVAYHEKPKPRPNTL
jgi:hypothetical protein